MGYVYIVKQKNSNLYKIGSTKNITQRTRHLNNISGGIIIKYIIESSSYKEDEKKLHKIFSSKRKDGEWFNLTEQNLEHIKELFNDDLIFK